MRTMRPAKMLGVIVAAVLVASPVGGGSATDARAATTDSSAAMALTAAAGPGDWPQFGHDPAHTGYNPSESAISASNVNQLGVAWIGSVDGKINGAPSVADGLVFVSATFLAPSTYIYMSRLYAFPAGCATGAGSCEPLWTSVPEEGTFHSPAIAGGVVYVASDSGLYAFDAAGTQACGGAPVVCAPLWSSTAGVQGSPVVAGGVVYATGVMALYAFDASGTTGCSGTPKRCAPLWSAPVQYTTSSPAVADGRVFIGAITSGSGAAVYAFDAAGSVGCAGDPVVCTPLWSAATAYPVYGSVAVSDGVAFATDLNGRLYAFADDCSSGGGSCLPLWTTTNNGYGSGTPAVANGVVYAPNEYNVRAFDAAGVQDCSGSPTVCGSIGGRMSDMSDLGVAVANGVVYHSGSRFIEGDREGSLGALWNEQTYGFLSTAPTVANGVLYVGGTGADGSGAVYALAVSQPRLTTFFCFPGSRWDTASIDVGQTATCDAYPGTGATFNGWSASGFTPTDSAYWTTVFTAATPGSASITASYTDAGGDHTVTFRYTITGGSQPAPTITSVTPPSGHWYGGDTVAIAGSNLAGATSVTFGGQEATSFSVVSDSEVTAVVPPSPFGPESHADGASVDVTTAGGTAELTNGFTYRGVAIVLLRGLASSLPDTTADDSFSQPGGLLEELSALGWGGRGLTLDFSYNPTPPGGTYAFGSAYSCGDTLRAVFPALYVASSGPTEVELLDKEIQLYAGSHPDTDFYLVGHSQGGAIAFAYLALVLHDTSRTPSDLAPGSDARLAGVATIDSPLGGIDLGVLESKLNAEVYSECGIADRKPSLAPDLMEFKYLAAGRAGLPSGGTASVDSEMYGLPSALSNDSLAGESAAAGVAILTMGNSKDLAYYLDDESTQWLTDATANGGPYARSIATTDLACQISRAAPKAGKWAVSQVVDAMLCTHNATLVKSQASSQSVMGSPGVLTMMVPSPGI